MDATRLQQRAKRRRAALARAWRDPRYARVIGRLVAAGVMETNVSVEPHREPIRIEDALWVGRVEPRVLELLPSLIVKCPGLFVDAAGVPPDLRAAVRSLRKGEEPEAFRGIPGAALRRWLPAVGRRGKLPSRLKSFRLQAEDLDLLEQLCERLGESQTDIVRRALRSLATAHLLGKQDDR